LDALIAVLSNGVCGAGDVFSELRTRPRLLPAVSRELREAEVRKSRRHGTNHPYLRGLLFVYQGATPGVELGDKATVLLGDEGEPQPDLYLRVLPENGGQSRTTPDDYVEGPPELVAEVAHSSRAIDLNAKRDDYARYGVLEYLVVNLADRRLHWLDLRTGQELPPDPDGVVRVRCFPGLWIHAEALLAKDYDRLMATLQQGLATPEHANFVRRLADAQPNKKRPEARARGEKTLRNRKR